MKKLNATLIMLLIIFQGNIYHLFGQKNETTVSGTITEISGEPIFAATVLLKKATDSTIVKMTLTDTTGHFTFENLSPSIFFVQVSEIGHETYKTDAFELIKDDRKQINIKQKILVNQLNEVIVKGSKPILERTIDKTIVNVEQSIISAGGTALEILERSPGIMVDKDGVISLRGKTGVNIYVDGKPSYLSGTELADLLRNMSASQLSQIEIMTNPSAKYEASGNGVVNIITKKTLSKGYSINISSSYLQGSYSGSNNSVNLNFTDKKINFYSTLGYRTLKSFEDYLIIRKISNEAANTLSVIEQNSRIENNNKGLNGKLGIDFMISKTTTIGGMISGFYNPNSANINSESIFKKSDNISTGTLNSPAFAEGQWRNVSTNLNFKHSFKLKGSELSADFDYIYYGSDKIQNFQNNYSNKTLPANSFKSNLTRNLSVAGFKIDYTHPLGENGKIETGLKFSIVKTDNNGDFFHQSGNNWRKNDSLSNHFLYDENINSAYFNYNSSFGKLEMQIGLRAEQTISNGNQLSINQSFSRNYLQVFPTAFFAYSLNDNHKIELNFGRRIERPNYKDLNPFRYYLDALTYEEGNPNLRPQISNNVELIHVLNDGMLTTTLSYSHADGIIQDIMYLNPTNNQAFERPENLSSSKNLSLSFDTEIPWSSVFSSTINVELLNKKYSGLINNKLFDLEANSFSGNVSNKIKFGKGWGFEITGQYTSKVISGTFIQNPFGTINLGIQKSFLKKKASLKLSVTDILYSTKNEGVSRYQDVDMYIFNKWQSQTARLTFTYKFNGGQKIEQKTKTGSVQQELDRIKGKE